MDSIQTELCEYLQVRHSKVDPASAPQDSPSSSTSSSPTGSSQTQAPLPTKFYKHWTTLWVVLKAEVVPNQCYIGYCKKEGDWLSDSQTIAKCSLGETFKVERPGPGYSKKYENVLQLTFKGYRLDLGFDARTKLEQWNKTLQSVAERYHVDLVRCPERPELEGEYVVQVCPSSYVIWSPGTPSLPPRPKWEWQLKHIRRVHWHKNVSKLEVEPGRSSGTGEGHFYFTGQHSYRLFRAMKHMMASHTTASPSSSSTSSTRSPQAGFSRRAGSEGGAEASSGGESDWTGTGDDWTGASSDSAFINFIRSQHQNVDKFRSPGVSPSPPPAQMGRPPLPRADEVVYMPINQQTMNEDNQYCTIQDLNKKPNSPSPSKRTALQPVIELTDSQDDDSEYCKMVPNSIRTELRQKAVENPSHLHHTYNYSAIPPPSNLHHAHYSSPSHLLHQVPPPPHAHRVSPAAQ